VDTAPVVVKAVEAVEGSLGVRGSDAGPVVFDDEMGLATI